MKKIQIIIFILVSLIVVEARGRGRPRPDPVGLVPNYYRVTRKCPQAEQIVRQITWARVRRDPTLGAKLLRVHYHDCFVRGCDASILLDTVGTTQSEKDAIPNLTLGGFDVIDEIKTRLESVCPGTVSCADILALAARDAVSFPFRRLLWDVLTGRKDGRVTLLSDVRGNLPSPFSDFPTLLGIFQNKNLSLVDLVALSGAHTIGVAHCGAFSRRLNFTGKGDTDPSLDPNYANFLRTQCTTPPDPTKTVEMDPRSSLSFDTRYFTTVRQNRGLFQSDAALLTDPTSARTVRGLQNPFLFFRQFAKSMVNMGAIPPPAGDVLEIRKNCRVVN